MLWGREQKHLSYCLLIREFGVPFWSVLGLGELNQEAKNCKSFVAAVCLKPVALRLLSYILEEGSSEHMKKRLAPNSRSHP